MKDFLKFKAAVKSRQVETGLTYKDLEQITKRNGANGGEGYTYKTIEKFMCGCYTCSDEKISKAIAEALNIPEYLAT